MTVYVTQEGAKRVNGEWVPLYDLTPALVFGPIEVLMPAGSSLFSTVPTVRALTDKLKGFSDDDFLLPMGDPTIMAIASMIASRNNSGRVKILKWDRGYSRYVPLQVDLSGRPV